jgi:hypothetical protein
MRSLQSCNELRILIVYRIQIKVQLKIKLVRENGKNQAMQRQHPVKQQLFILRYCFIIIQAASRYL